MFFAAMTKAMKTTGQERRKHQLTMRKLLLMVALMGHLALMGQVKPRILVSTDIGGTDPDDNQSMIHLLMYANEFDIEGLVSSPSFGAGSAAEIVRMIDLYGRDRKQLAAHTDGYPTVAQLKAVVKQGRRGPAPLQGFAAPTEGSEWIVKCARRSDERPLWVLVWGALEDVAQALHDAPDIAPRLRVYWIGGPNKKWGANAYRYVAEHFPHLWMIENNATYRGFIGNGKDPSHHQAAYWRDVMKGHGAMGDDFKHYYNGIVKMGDTPSLLYLMGNDERHLAVRGGRRFDINDPTDDHWGGRFEPMRQSPCYVITGPLTERDTVPVYSLLEWRLKGPLQNDADFPRDSVCFTLHIDRQDWGGCYEGHGIYVVRYAPKAPATLHYAITSPLAGFPVHAGTLTVGREWPAVGTYSATSPTITARPMAVGPTWWTDCRDTMPAADGDQTGSHQPTLAQWQGATTTACWRNEILDDWAERFAWLGNETTK